MNYDEQNYDSFIYSLNNTVLRLNISLCNNGYHALKCEQKKTEIVLIMTFYKNFCKILCDEYKIMSSD